MLPLEDFINPKLDFASVKKNYVCKDKIYSLRDVCTNFS